MIKRTINVFSGGRNTDDSKAIISQDQYLEAHNLELVGDGTFKSLQNIKGTTNVKEIVNDSTVEEVGAFACKFLIGGVKKDCNVYFTVDDSSFKIWCYDTVDNQLYELFQEPVGTSDRIVDVRNYPENDVDVIYFTDFYKELRYFRCVIPTPYTPNFLSPFRISLQRKGAVGSIVTNVITDGSLLTGSYQFCYRMVDPDSKSFTKWSVPTNPIHIYSVDNNPALPIPSAGIGLLSNRGVRLIISPSTNESSSFKFVQLAVIENTGTQPPLTASLLEITPIVSTFLFFEYKANTRIGTIPLSDITVDLAAIETCKTIAIKENRLYGGNVKYAPLNFDRGTPSITSGLVITEVSSVANGFGNELFSSTRKGYFRNEVYRFGVVYEDENGNKSPAIPLDLSVVTNNRIGTGIKDIKFPGRDTSSAFTLFNTSGFLQSLGLRLNGIKNHPSWARKLHIVRLQRKENIIAQSPAILMATVEGIGALDDYPSKYFNGAADQTIEGAQPQTASQILVPKNMFFPEMRNIKQTSNNSGSGSTFTKKGEAEYVPFGYSTFLMIFDSVYSDPYQFSGSEKITVVDKALLRARISDDSIITPGDHINTNISGMFYALKSGDYFFDPNWGAKSIAPTEKNLPIIDAETFTNLGNSASVSGRSVMDYQALDTTGIQYGYRPNIQKSTVVNIGDFQMGDVQISSNVQFANGTLNKYSAGSQILAGQTLSYESSLTNRYVSRYSGFSQEVVTGAVNIVNVELGLGDDRYGDFNAFHEYIPTGATYTFTNTDIASLEAGGNVLVNLDVWGGDCFVAPHIFKITDSAYSIVNQRKKAGAADSTNDLIEKWNYFFRNSSGAAISIPVAVESAAQYITVILESKYNGTVRDKDILSSFVNESGFPVYVPSDDVARTPLTYNYNINLSKENNDKIFTTRPLYSFTQNNFPSRVIYSDIKIYNSDQQGFDIFRVGNLLDLEEQRYDINKLAVARDNLYAIQERGVYYLPTGERQIEQTDSDTLAVRTGDVIGRPILIDGFRGSQHIRGIVETGSVIYIPDNFNKNVYVLSGTDLQSITKDNESLFREIFNQELIEKSVVGFYDFVRDELLLVAGGKTQIFNPRIGWVGDYEFVPSSGLFNNKLYVTGKVGDSLSIYTMYTGSVNQLFGNLVTPRVTLCINPEGEVSKTFDVLMLPATNKLYEGDLVVEHESGNQVINGINFDIPYIEGNIRTPIGRDAFKARARGLRALLTVKWKEVQSALSSVHTKYYDSKRSPF